MAGNGRATDSCEVVDEERGQELEDKIETEPSWCQYLGDIGLTATSVICFTLPGVALRVALGHVPTSNSGLTRSSTQPRSTHCFAASGYSGYFWQNALGCVFMGMVTRHKHRLNKHIATGISTGFCGALTTWSTWMLNSSFTFLNGDGWNAVVSAICMFAVSLLSFDLGAYVAGCFLPYRQKANKHVSRGADGVSDGVSDGEIRDLEEDDATRHRAKSMLKSIPQRFANFYADEMVTSSTEEKQIEAEVEQAFREHKCMEVTLHVGVVVTALVILIVSVCIMILVPGLDVDTLRYLAFAPFGSITRWLLFLVFSRLPAQWHLMHVVVANTLACLIDAFSQILAYRAQENDDDFAFLWWSGVITGLDGCLSTVSTMIAELRKAELAKCCLREFYLVLLFGLAALVMLPTLGAVQCEPNN